LEPDFSAYHGRPELSKPWSLSGFTVVTEFELRALWGMRSILISSLIVEPILYIALLVAGLQGIVGDWGDNANRDYITFVFPGLLALQGLQAFVRVVYRSTAERRWGLLALKRLSGVGPLGYVLGMAVTFVAAFVVQALVATPVGMLLGLKLSLSGWLATVSLGSVLVLFWAGLGILLTAVVRNYQQRDTIISLLMLPLTFSAPVFYSLEGAPRYLQIIAQFNPLTCQVLAMRNAFQGSPDFRILAIAVGCSAIAVVAAVISINRGELLGSEI
jgi:ABC-2 type transport system permease protein